MKKIITLLFLGCFLSALFAQKTINFPSTGFKKGAAPLTITKICITDTATILFFEVKFRPKNWINIPKETYIQPVGSAEKLYIKSAKNIEINKKFTMPASGITNYQLNFPAIDKKYKTLDYGEDNGSWFIYDISLTKESNATAKLSRNWYNVATGEWELSIHDSVAVFESKLWKCTQLPNTKKPTGIVLQNGNTLRKFNLKWNKDNTINLEESSNKILTLSSSQKLLPPNPNFNEKFALPVFSLDSALYSGYIQNYNKRVGAATINIYVNNIITGNQNSFLTKIAENGTFSVKLPVLHPQYVFVRSEAYNGSVYLEPGKSVFHLIAPQELFMGESARINSDLSILSKANLYKYEDMMNRILDMNRDQFKTYYTEMQKSQFRIIDSLEATGMYSAKAIQITKAQANTIYPEILLRYSSYFESAYRSKHNLTDRKTQIPVQIDRLTAKDIDFISQNLLTNQINLISNDFSSFVNRLNYIEPIYNSRKTSVNLQDLVRELNKNGNTLSDSEKEAVNSSIKVDSLLSLPYVNAYFSANSKRFNEFMLKYKEPVKVFFDTNPTGTHLMLEKYLKKQKTKLSPEDFETLKGLQKMDTMKAYIGLKESSKNHLNDSIKSFNQKHDMTMAKLRLFKRAEILQQNMRDSLNLDPGLVGDLITSQTFCNRIVDEMSPLNETDLARAVSGIENPFVAAYIVECNNEIKSKIEANKHKKGFVLNETPRTDADKVFDAIMQKYRGKVVYVDFWATWCSPCRSGIERIKPLKEEMDSSKVAFVNITNPSSPLEIYKNMIPNIKGEHYRLTQDEWNFLSSKFNITGIPHYVLVGKQGEVIDPQLKFMSNSEIKQLLMHHINGQ